MILASTNRASVRHAESHKCPLFLTSATVFFRIQPDTGPASQDLVDTLKQERVSRLRQVLKGRGLDQAQKCDNSMTKLEGFHLYFGCAIQTNSDQRITKDSGVGVSVTNSLDKRPKHKHTTLPHELLRDLPACSSSTLESPPFQRQASGTVDQVSASREPVIADTSPSELSTT